MTNSSELGDYTSFSIFWFYPYHLVVFDIFSPVLVFFTITHFVILKVIVAQLDYEIEWLHPI